MVRLLITRGAAKEARSKGGDTPLQLAVDVNSKEAMIALVESGCRTDTKDNHGRTPLHSPFCTDAAVFALLLKNGADPNARDDKGRTPLHVLFGEVSTRMARVLIDGGAEVNARDKRGRTPLHYSAMYGELDLTNLLLENGADPLAPDAEGATPLDFAREGRAEVEGPDRQMIVAILEIVFARHKLATIGSQFRVAATCVLTCAALLALGFVVIAVKMARQRRKRRAGA
jgi:ankyrin repeat protein